MVAHPRGPLLFSAKRTADLLKRKMPPVCPSASRATQSLALFRAIKKSGIDSLSTPESGRRGNLAVLPTGTTGLGWSVGRFSFTTGQMPRKGGRRASTCAGRRIMISSVPNDRGKYRRPRRRGCASVGGIALFHAWSGGGRDVVNRR